jgi:hypothetical protein
MTSPGKPRLGRALLWLLVALAVSLAMLNWKVSSPDLRVAPDPPSAQPREPAARVSPQSPAPHRTLVTPSQSPASVLPPVIEDVESHCRPITSFGRCRGDVAEACVANEVVRIDCAARHGRCVLTSEGAQCLPHTPGNSSECIGREAATCSGTTLLHCVDGSWARFDCATRKGTCEPEQDGAHCANDTPAPSRIPVDVCDGVDNDADGRVDEAGACDAVKLVAFVANGFDPARLEARMQVELSILNRVYAPTVFQWARTTRTDAAGAWFASELLTPVARKLARGEIDGFYVPVLFVARLTGQPPKAGRSTLPNGRCGGVRVSDAASPTEGLIVLAEARHPDTLAHEMGHYLGLCHTFEQLAPVAPRNPVVAECKRTGDAICDTPPDPGPEQCATGPGCVMDCGNAPEVGDPSNIMSYYMGCRRLLTAEQLAEANRNLALRRGWFPCLDPKACPCDPGAHEQCPAEMSCQPDDALAGSFTCNLDGPSLPGVPCLDSNQCGAGSFCLEQSSGEGHAAHCVRPCREGDACTCDDVGLPFRVCAEDLPFAIGAAHDRANQ